MTAKDKAAPKAAKEAEADATEAAEAAEASDKVIEAAQVESPVSGTGPVPVFRTDLGESLPPQKKPGVV